jgi:hypothetical protein
MGCNATSLFADGQAQTKSRGIGYLPGTNYSGRITILTIHQIPAFDANNSHYQYFTIAGLDCQIQPQ